jgi:hypothetical protein
MTEDVVYCEAKTNASLTGGSWASTGWSCQRKATEEVVIERRFATYVYHLCWQHAAMVRKEGSLR